MSEAEQKVPMNCTDDELCAMEYDNVQVGDFSIMTDTHTVWLSQQAMGEYRTQHCEISRDAFNKLIRWYTQGIVPKEDRRSR